MKSPVQLFIALAILLATATVAAQVYKWVDKDGKVQYSDTPPPASATKAEAKRIDAAPAVTSTSAAPVKSLQDRTKDYDKRKADDAEKAKKIDVAKQNTEINASNCSNARSVLRELETGRPVTRTTESGTREFMDDDARQAEMAKARKSVADFCKG